MADARLTQIRVEELVQLNTARVAYYPEGSREGTVQEDNLVTLIESWDGTAFELSSGDISSTSFDWSQYDALAVLHATTGSGGSTTVAEDVRAANENYGIPLYLSFQGWGDAETSTNASFNPELWGTHRSRNNVVGGIEIQIVSTSTHPIVTALSTGWRSITGLTAHGVGLDSTSLFVGQSLGMITSTVHSDFSTAGQTSLVAVPTGSAYLSSTTTVTGGRIAGVGPEVDEVWNSSGEAFFGAVMDWLVGEGPMPPDLNVVPGSTTATLLGGAYRHLNSSDVTHGWRRYQVDISTGVFSTAVFYDSGWSTNLGDGFVDLLTINTTGYKARVADRGSDLSTGRWSAVVSFDTLTPTTGIFALSGGLRVDFESSTGVLSSLEYLTASTVYVETIAENISIPAGTTKITARAIKRGLDPGVASVRRALIEPGSLVVGYHPSPFTTGGGP